MISPSSWWCRVSTISQSQASVQIDTQLTCDTAEYGNYTFRTSNLNYIYVRIFFRLFNDISDVNDNIMAEAMMIKLEELGVGVWVTANTKVKCWEQIKGEIIKQPINKVVRGHDWSGGDADGEGEGVVTKVIWREIFQ